ncbi:hypothetical protein SFUMM280S_00594 [Streptomyces fumanus]
MTDSGTREETAVRRRGRDETEEERADRMWTELIQEVRVAQMGVQILFGFLLTVVFQPKYDALRLSDTDQRIYLITVVLGACATGALIGPVAAPPGLRAARQTAGGAVGRRGSPCSGWCCCSPPRPPRCC